MHQVLNYLRGKRAASPNAPTAASAARAQADLARDRRDWPEAERLYSEHLAAEPGDQPIWIQFGHALKEQGKLQQAEDAYRRAASLADDDAEAHLQLAHCLKMQMKLAEAEAAFARALLIDPAKTTYDEMAALGGTDRAGQIVTTALTQASSDTVLFEVDDLLGWLTEHRHLSGIQRVQAGIVRSLIAAIPGQGKAAFGFVRARTDTGTIWQVWPTDLKNVIDYATGPKVQRDRLDALLAKADRDAVALETVPGQCYIILGAFWGTKADAGRFARLKRSGVAVGVYIYDLIPITHPEYYEAPMLSDFLLSLGDGLSMFDFVLTISEHTARDVRHFQKEMKTPPVPVVAVPLAHVMNDEATGDASQSENVEAAPAIRALAGRQFVLSVSTIEARKNHAYLFLAWRLMRAEGLDPPDLVFVGRLGGRVNDLMEQIRATDFLDGHLHVLHNLSDGELAWLYRHCRFTTFPSFVEGWGLPVGESLAHGRPCIASDTSSIPEVGGDLVDYIDPYNLRSGLQAFRRMSFDDAYWRKRQRDVQTGFKARGWASVTENLLEQIARLRPRHVDTNVDPLLRPGELFYPGKLRFGEVIPRNYASRPLRLILTGAWYQAEAFGCWMRGGSGELRFRTGLSPATPLAIYLLLRGAAWSKQQYVTVTVRRGEDTADNPAEASPSQLFPPHAKGKGRLVRSGDFLVRAIGETGAEGRVRVLLTVTGQPGDRPHSESRDVSVGLIGLSYACKTDPVLQSDIAATFAVGGSEPAA